MSNTLDILDCKGTRVGEYVIPEGVIELEKGEQAVHDTVTAYLAGQRAGTAHQDARRSFRRWSQAVPSEGAGSCPCGFEPESGLGRRRYDFRTSSAFVRKEGQQEGDRVGAEAGVF